MHTAILLAFAFYTFILLCIGFAAHKKASTESDFVIGGRQINFWVTALTAHASDMSSWLFMGLPMAIYVGGFSQSWIALGLVTGMFLNWHFVAPRLRTLTEQYDANTLSSFFSAHFGDKRGMLRYISALVTLVFMTHYLAAGLIGMGFLFESVFGIEYHVGICIACAIVAVYTCVGGYVAVAWADTFQGIFLLVMIILVPIFAWMHIDASQVETLSPAFLSLLPDGSLNVILVGMSWSLGYFGSPHILTKFMGIRNVENMYKAKWLGISWQLLTLSASIAIGAIGVLFFSETLPNPELVFVEMVKVLFHPFVAGFVLCGILAASISTMDSQLLVVSGVVSEDLYRFLVRPQASNRELLLISRLGLCASTIAALSIAWEGSQTVLDTVQYSWMGLGAAFGPVMLMALYSKKSTQAGAVSGMVVGSLVVALWSVPSVPAMIPAFASGLLSIWLVSLVSQPKPPVQETVTG